MAVNEFCCAKLSPHKKSIFGLRMGSQILYLFVLTASFLVICSSADTELSCANVKTIFERKGILSSVDIQEQPNSDAGGLCRGMGCCGSGALAPLTAAARTQLQAALSAELSKLSDILATRGRKFDEFFRKLLQLSREEFHAMFKRTYGMIYEQHSYVFEQLFEQLERYYARGDTDFDLMMEGFFGILYQKMFTVLNSQYSFDEKYLKCVNEHMREIQPFEDVPSKLSVQLRRAFVATRTFHKALRAGADVARNMMQVTVTQECAVAWAGLRHCGGCSGLEAPVCSRYCHNVLRGCLPEHADLGEHWDAYVDAVEKVADRLLGPFNIAMVVEPIDIKISEAIMSFQEHNREISQKIFAGCGKPVLGGQGGAGPFFAPDGSRRPTRSLPDFDWKANGDGDDFEIEASFESLLSEDPALLTLRTPEGIRRVTRDMAKQAEDRDRVLRYLKGQIDRTQYQQKNRIRREADPAAGRPDQIDFRAFEFDGKRGGGKKKKINANKADDGHGSDWGGPALERLVRETRGRLRSSKRYWSHLPALLCATASVTTAPCYNGTHVASYLWGPAGEGSAALASNPEVRSAAGVVTGSTLARTQREALRTLTQRLKDAYNGQEVHWTDIDDLQVASSSLDSAISEGSGSGSGDDSDDDDDDLPDDDEDRQDFPEGSGAGPVPPSPPVTAPPRPPQPPAPLPPTDIDSVNSRGRVILPAVESEPQPQPPSVDLPPPRPAAPPAAQPPLGPTPSESSAPPTLHQALFTYAFPVVCAWFGTIITDLF